MVYVVKQKNTSLYWTGRSWSSLEFAKLYVDRADAVDCVEFYSGSREFEVKELTLT